MFNTFGVFEDENGIRVGHGPLVKEVQIAGAFEEDGFGFVFNLGQKLGQHRLRNAAKIAAENSRRNLKNINCNIVLKSSSDFRKEDLILWNLK